MLYKMGKNPASKLLNPNAEPFITPKTRDLVLHSKPFFPISVFKTNSMQNISFSSTAPRVSMPGRLVYWYHQPTPNWAEPVYYDAHKQPSVAMGVSLYHQHVGEEPYSKKIQAAGSEYENVKGRDVGSKKVLDVFGREKTKRHFSKRQAPRFRCLKKWKFAARGEQTWKPKNFMLDKKILGSGSGSKLEKKGGDDKLVASPVCNGDEINFGGHTSLMIRNIPNQFERRTLIDILDQHCLEENRKAHQNSDPSKSEYDFLYLPMDFKNRANYGYAFVNFTNAAGALRFRKAFNKFEWDVPVNKKTCEICIAKIQGKDAFKNHFKNSVFTCHTSCYLPVVLSPPRDGEVHSKPIEIGRWLEPRHNSRRNPVNHTMS